LGTGGAALRKPRNGLLHEGGKPAAAKIGQIGAKSIKVAQKNLKGDKNA